jgi:hypothetical protein
VAKAPSSVVLVEGRIGDKTGRIVLEYTANGGKEVVYHIDGHAVTRETFALAVKFAATITEELHTNLLSQILIKLVMP